AGTMDVAGPLQQAHQLTYAAESARAASAPAGDALAAWDAAVQAWDHLDCPYALGRALLAAAGARMGGGGRAGAAERRGRAAPLAEGTPAARGREQIESRAGRARLSLPAGTTGSQAAGSFGLTAREIEVLRLVAAGRSNRDIAAELFISTKTASVHVSNILAKLNVTSRTEAAAMAYRAGLAGNGP